MVHVEGREGEGEGREGKGQREREREREREKESSETCFSHFRTLSNSALSGEQQLATDNTPSQHQATLQEEPAPSPLPPSSECVEPEASLSGDFRVGSPVVDEVPVEVENQVLASGVLLSSPHREGQLLSGDLESALPTCPSEEEDEQGAEEGAELEEEDGSGLDGYVARELEELMSKLSEASSMQYKLSSSNMVICDSDQPELPVLYEDMVQQCGATVDLPTQPR